MLCLKKVKGKDTDPDSAFYMRQAHSSTFGNKTANTYVKKLISLQLNNDWRRGRCYWKLSPRLSGTVIKNGASKIMGSRP